MPRPQKIRFVLSQPELQTFGPRDEEQRETVQLTVEEFEAIRLADYVGMDQETGAGQMGISRHTFGRLLGKARKNVAQALVLGRELRIEGGNYECRGSGRRRRQGAGCGRGHGRR